MTHLHCGLGQSLIEDELTHAVSLDIRRRRTDDAAPFLENKVSWIPTGFRGGTAAALRSGQKFMFQKR
jgi:hypothetical protein